MAATATLFDRMAEAWVNRRHRVCGLRLDDYCAHHIQLLTVLRSPLLGQPGASPVDWPALLLACEIARTPYEAEIRLASVRRRLLWVWPRVLLTVLRWRLKNRSRSLTRSRSPLRAPLRVSRRAYPLLASRLLLLREARRFRAWQNDHQAEPDLFFDNEGTELTAPPLLARVIFVMRHLHIEERRAWTMSIGKLLWHYAATLEQVGTGVRMLEPDDADDMETVRRIQAGEIPIPPEMAAQIEAALRAAENTPAAKDRSELNLSVFGPA